MGIILDSFNSQIVLLKASLGTFKTQKIKGQSPRSKLI